MKSQIWITMLLVKVLLIDPTATSFAYKNEWDCMNKVLFNHQIMKILQELDESDCQDELPDPLMLFANINVMSDEYDSSSTMDDVYNFSGAPASIDNYDFSEEEDDTKTIIKNSYFDYRNNGILDLIDINYNFEIKASDAHIKTSSLFENDYEPNKEAEARSNDIKSEADNENEENDKKEKDRKLRLDKGLSLNEKKQTIDEGLGDDEFSLIDDTEPQDQTTETQIAKLVKSALTGSSDEQSATYRTYDGEKISIDVLRKKKLDIDQHGISSAKLVTDLDEIQNGSVEFVDHSTPPQMIITEEVDPSIESPKIRLDIIKKVTSSMTVENETDDDQVLLEKEIASPPKENKPAETKEEKDANNTESRSNSQATEPSDQAMNEPSKIQPSNQQTTPSVITKEIENKDDQSSEANQSLDIVDGPVEKTQSTETSESKSEIDKVLDDKIKDSIKNQSSNDSIEKIPDNPQEGNEKSQSDGLDSTPSLTESKSDKPLIQNNNETPTNIDLSKVIKNNKSFDDHNTIIEAEKNDLSKLNDPTDDYSIVKEKAENETVQEISSAEEDTDPSHEAINEKDQKAKDIVEANKTSPGETDDSHSKNDQQEVKEESPVVSKSSLTTEQPKDAQIHEHSSQGLSSTKKILKPQIEANNSEEKTSETKNNDEEEPKKEQDISDDITATKNNEKGDIIQNNNESLEKSQISSQNSTLNLKESTDVDLDPPAKQSNTEIPNVKTINEATPKEATASTESVPLTVKKGLKKPLSTSESSHLNSQGSSLSTESQKEKKADDLPESPDIFDTNKDPKNKPTTPIDTNLSSNSSLFVEKEQAPSDEKTEKERINDEVKEIIQPQDQTISKLEETDTSLEESKKTSTDDASPKPEENTASSEKSKETEDQNESVAKKEENDDSDSKPPVDESNNDALEFKDATEEDIAKNSTPAVIETTSVDEKESENEQLNKAQEKQMKKFLTKDILEDLAKNDNENNVVELDPELPGQDVIEDISPPEITDATRGDEESETTTNSETVNQKKNSVISEFTDEANKRSHGSEESDEKDASVDSNQVKAIKIENNTLLNHLYDPSQVDYKAQKFVIRQHPIIQMTKFVQSNNRIGERATYYARQYVKTRMMESKRSMLRGDVMRQIFDSFLLLPKCVQKALQWCSPNFDNLRKACENNKKGEKCRIQEFYAVLNCGEDETMINQTCYKNCPKGFVEYKAFCLKPSYIKRSTKEYRGERLKENEEFWGDHLIVEKCSIYGHYMEAAGPDYCRAYCPTGFQDRGIYCQKPYRFLRQPVVYFDQNNANQAYYDDWSEQESD